jgi:predicted metal-binding membrane protein
MSAAIEAGLRRHRMIALAALSLLTLLAWVWLLRGAGIPDDAMVGMAGMEGMAMPPSPVTAERFGLTFAMWWTMMVAMMLPAAAPTVLLYARAAARPDATPPASAAFLAGHLLVWGGFSLAAAALQLWLEHALLLAPSLRLESARLGGAVLLAAGAYQLSPLKDACLNQCRNPAQFLSRHYRPGQRGALRMGLLHGLWCLGCCWLLMALLFAAGIMDLAWIAGLTLLVAAEKLLPFGPWLARGAGLACLGGGAWLLLAR